MQLLQKCRNVTIVDLIESESVNSLTASLPEYQMKRTSVKLRSIMTTAMIKHSRSQNEVCICSSQAKRAPFVPESMHDRDPFQLIGPVLIVHFLAI